MAVVTICDKLLTTQQPYSTPSHMQQMHHTTSKDADTPLSSHVCGHLSSCQWSNTCTAHQAGHDV